MDHVFRMEYSAAENSLLALPNDAPARPYFMGVVCLNRFQDWGDTASLRRAQEFWERLSTEKRPAEKFQGDSVQLHVYRGLALMQLSYIAALRGSELRSGSLALKGQSELSSTSIWEKGGIAEADAGLALFDYYRKQVLASLPFVHPNTQVPLHNLEIAAGDSRYLGDVFHFSAFWMFVDHEEIDSALKISNDFLQRYPHNRMARQMQGSALYHAGKLSEARGIYEELLREYGGLRDSLPPDYLPVGYYCAWGNLARIYSKLDLKPQEAICLVEWRKALDYGLSPWLPSSLKRELARLSKQG